MIQSGHLLSLAADREPRHKYPDLVDAVPKTSGVYMIFDEDDKCIYVGKSDSETTTIRSRLQDHINGGDVNTRCINNNNPVTFSFVEKRDILRSDVSALEAMLIKDYKAEGQARCNDRTPRSQSHVF
ncbi:MAG: GIY-YIG nuclease family protein [Spirochaetaceae bacterium]|nr:GIY-YIG nuclease family protein [Spirochaetaceae bacterium]